MEAMGALATGGLVAHAMAGEAHGDTGVVAGVGAHAQLHDCQNCGALLGGPYCHACGQSGHVHRTLGHVIEEFAHGVFHVESKGWRTLPMLIVNPGRLTREYVHGKRARYIAPLALFLFMIFLTFFTFGMTGGKLSQPIGPENPRIEAANDLRDAQRELDRELKDKDNTAADLLFSRQAVEKARKALAIAPDHAAAHVGVNLVDDKGRTLATKDDWISTIQEANAKGKINVNTGYAPFDARVHHALNDPEFAIYKVQEKAAKLSFLLVPLSLPILWLLFAGRRGVNLYDHTVFSLYSLSFMSLLVVAIMLLGSVGLGVASSVLVLVPPLHMFAQLKGTYRLSVRGALWRTAVLSIASLFVLALFAGLMLFIGLID